MKLGAVSIVTAQSPLAPCSASNSSTADRTLRNTEFFSGSSRPFLDAMELMLTSDSDWAWPTGRHKMSLAFDCSSLEAFDAAFAALIADSPGTDSTQGAPSSSSPVASMVQEPWDAFWGQRYAVVSDPDWDTVDLFATQRSAEREVSVHRDTGGTHLRSRPVRPLRCEFGLNR